MRSIKLMKAAKIGYIIMSLVYSVCGILLLVVPGIMAPIIAEMFGILLILFGVVKLIGYFSKDLFRLAFQYDLACGLFLIVLGVVTLLRTDHFIAFISVVLGIYVLADGFLKIQTAIDARVFGIRQWWMILATAILAGVAGIFLILRPQDGAELLAMLFGFCLLAEGLLSLTTVLAAVKIIKHQWPDRIDGVEIYR